MPNDPSHRGHDAEQLSRKIERLLSGQPNPLLDDDTEELAEIARLLHEHLPKDVPDPGFRAQLKQDLIDPQPRLLNLPPRRMRRYPVPALAGALAVVMLATAATGWMAFGERGHGSDDVAGAEMPTLTLSASSSSVAVAFATRTASEQLREDEENAIRPTATTAQPENTATAEPTAADATPTATSVVTEEPQATELPPRRPSREVAAVNLPPVDRDHVELGALATTGPEASGEFDRVTFEIDGMLPQLESQAPAYHFSTPFVDSRIILRSIGEFLGIDEKPHITELNGRQAYTLASDSSNASFTWFPSSGAFSCTLHSDAPENEDADLRTIAIDWLRDFGFPVDPERAQPVVQTMDDGQRIVHVPISEVPDPAVGHPLRVSLAIDDHGRVVSVSGYWLQSTGTVDVPLLSAEDAWRALTSGRGYWPDRPAAGEPGRFVIEEFDVSYMLTLADSNDQLVLQPVIRAGGTFHPEDGEPETTAIFLQAAVSTSET